MVTLDLHDNNIGDDGTRYIAEMVKENCYISSLVSFNGPANSNGLCQRRW